MLTVLSTIKHNNVLYEKGDIISDIEKDEATRLVNLGVAFFASEDGDYLVVENDTESMRDDKKELDQAYNHEDLKTLAKEIGMEFPSNISKSKLIEQIIEEEKVDLFFE